MTTLKSIYNAGLAITLAGFAVVTAAPAQSQLVLLSPAQSLIAVHIGNGVTAGKDVIGINSTSTTPLIVIHALSGVNGQYGSLLSIAALNTNRILGINGAGGLNSPNSITLNKSDLPTLPVLTNPGLPILLGH